MSGIADVTEATFASDVVEASHTRPVVVDFWAPWCGPCHQLAPVLEKMAAKYGGDVDVVKLNTDQAPNVARTYRIQGIPAVKAFSGGAVISEFVGVQPEQVIDRFFAALAPSKSDRLVAEAHAAPEADKERLLRDALSLQPDHPEGVVALARILVARNETDEATTILSRVPRSDQARKLLAEIRLRAAAGDDLDDLRAQADSGDAGAKLRLGRVLAGRGDLTGALPLLLEAVRDPDTREHARTAVLEVFDVAGPDSDVVRTWRPKLAAALF